MFDFELLCDRCGDGSGVENYSNLFYTHPATYLPLILLWQPISKSYSRCPSLLIPDSYTRNIIYLDLFTCWLLRTILAKGRPSISFKIIIPQAHIHVVNWSKILSATHVIGFPWRPVFKAPGCTISPLPSTLSFSITCSNVRFVSRQCCQEIIGSLVRDRGKVSIGLSNWEAEAPCIDPGSWFGKVFVAAISVKKMCPTRRTTWKQIVYYLSPLWVKYQLYQYSFVASFCFHSSPFLEKHQIVSGMLSS